MVLDGRNRLAACKLADVEPTWIAWQGDGDPTAWVVSQNLHRRHLTESQRAMVAARLATLGRGRPETNAQICVFSPSQSEAATLLNVGRRSVQSARTVQSQGIPDLVDAVDSGEIAVSRAAGIAKAPPEDQPALVEEARKPHVSRNSGNNEWYTPEEFIELARAVMGGIDCDPASSALANETVKATTYYDEQDDGLSREWPGRVWMNPPYATPLIGLFCDALVRQLGDGATEQACVLVNNATDTAWCRKLLAGCSAVCLLRGRVRFIGPEGERGTPLQGQILLYFGDEVEAFAVAAGDKGKVVYP